MDKARLSVAVCKRTGFPLEPGDPAFALVELNRLVLEDFLEAAAERVGQRLSDLPERIQASGVSLARELSTQGVERVVEMLAASRRTIATDTQQAQRQIAEQAATARENLARQEAVAVRPAPAAAHWALTPVGWLMTGAAIAVASCTGGFLAGGFVATHELVISQSSRR